MDRSSHTRSSNINVRLSQVARYDHHKGNDEYSQAGDLYRLLKPDAQERLVSNIVESLSGARQDILMRQLCHFFRADPKYGMQLAAG